MAVFTDISTDELLSALPSLEVPKASPSVAGAHILIIGGSIGGLAAAACLRAAGFVHVQVCERSTALQVGAGVGVDDASVAILKGLGVVGGGGTMPKGSLQRMRWTEDRTASGQTLVRQPYPYCAALYSEVQRGLAALLPEESITYGQKIVSAEALPDGSMRVHAEDGSVMACDLVVAADGPRSVFRDQVEPGAGAMRFARYFGLRGMVPVDSLPERTRASLHSSYPDFGNCLYFVLAEGPRQSAVLYDIGKGLVNWLIYENSAEPFSQAGQTTAKLPAERVRHLKNTARRIWGDALGGIIEATPEPFVTDIYDLQEPLSTFFRGSLALLGDSAHGITPHMAKGSNLAMHDAFVLASSAAEAADLTGMLQEYSAARAQECARCLLLSRHLGRLRNGLVRGSEALPRDGSAFQALLRSQGLATRTLPVGDPFESLWTFIESRLPEAERGFFLEAPERCAKRAGKRKTVHTVGDRESADEPERKRDTGPLTITALNHVSRETSDVRRLRDFYHDVLGLPVIKRPDFPFGGAWLQLQPGLSLHIIERDPEKPAVGLSEPPGDAAISGCGRVPERFIRRSHHIALTVQDINATKVALEAHGVHYATNYVPGTSIVQLFLYDPDGNGVEIGNFDAPQ